MLILYTRAGSCRFSLLFCYYVLGLGAVTNVGGYFVCVALAVDNDDDTILGRYFWAGTYFNREKHGQLSVMACVSNLQAAD
jgi:hypothetical protein